MRALAFSAVRAGLRLVAVDLFGDWDLRQVADCRCVEVSGYPNGLLVPELHPDGVPWMYTGSLENYPHLLEPMLHRGPLLGNAGESLAAVRDPFRLARLLGEEALSTIPVAHAISADDANADWLVKPLWSGGGRGITIWTGDAVPEGCFLQRRMPGLPHAAVFVGSVDGAKLLGVTRQLIGEEFCNAAPFAYCGSVGPIAVSREVERSLQRFGQVLAVTAGLRGLFGVDFLLEDDQVWPLEVNPRYTASVEILERAAGVSVLPLHLAAFGKADPITWHLPLGNVFGKAILFAPNSCSVRADAPCYDEWIPADACYADIPMPGTQLQAGEPVLTIFARGSTVPRCLQMLKTEAMGFTDGWLLPVFL